MQSRSLLGPGPTPAGPEELASEFKGIPLCDAYGLLFMQLEMLAGDVMQMREVHVRARSRVRACVCAGDVCV